VARGRAHDLRQLPFQSFRALSVLLVLLGVLVGVAFPFVVVADGVATADTALTGRFIVSCVLAGVLLGGVCIGLVRVTIGRRLRRLADRMTAVAAVVAEGGTRITEAHRVPVLSDDVLGAPAAAFDVVLDALARAWDREQDTVAELRTRAEVDELTGVLNRSGWHAHAERALQRATACGDAVHLLVVDLDGFKAVNDEHGHQAGDLVLQVSAQRLRELCRADDLVARTGGDEFVVLLVGGGVDLARERVALVAAALAVPVRLARGAEVGVGASVGTASTVPGEHLTGALDALVAYADRQMYRVKNARPRTATADTASPPS
jgi:two-component system cell cycle response regulator